MCVFLLLLRVADTNHLLEILTSYIVNTYCKMANKITPLKKMKKKKKKGIPLGAEIALFLLLQNFSVASESSCLFYLSFNFDFYVSKIMHL